MCGIVGIYNYKSDSQVDSEKLVRMRDIMSHRGPDGFGIYINGNIGLAHRRLSILDLSENGSQPFKSSDGRYVITFNGEIFNYLELRPELEKDGFKFISNSDTEVLLYLYVKYGVKMLDMLNGMFAFAIWDNLDKSLFVARDRLGVKPLYYADFNGQFLFSSEQKALLEGGIPKEIEEQEINELLLYRFTSGTKSIFKNVSRLLPGHSMVITNGKINITRWWNLGEKIISNRNKIPSNPFEWFDATFKSSLKYRMISDVPVGVLLSGGLDSSSVVAALNQTDYKNMSTFTVGFEEQSYDESKLAELVAKKFGFQNYLIRLDADQVFESIKQAAWFHDEPLIHQNDAQMLAISQFAKNHVSVLLSGEASDELMGGYVRYKPLQYLKYKSLIKPLVGIASQAFQNPRLKKLLRFYDMDNKMAVMDNSCSLYPDDFRKLGVKIFNNGQFDSYRSLMYEEAKIIFPGEEVRQAMYLDQHTFLGSLLDRNDRMTMGASIECRVPFLDFRLVEMIGALPSKYLLKGTKGKFLLFNSVGKTLPAEIRNFRKNGFSVPWEKYLLSNDQFICELQEMKKNPIFQFGILKFIDINLLINGLKNNDVRKTTLLRQLLMLHFWFKHYYNRF
jgi:asparagine synthase (glutamine-hydrolysing)